jgi:VanZ family protein
MVEKFKHKRPITYISLVIYVLLSTFIIIESCLSSSISGGQSNLFAQISAFFVNLFKGPQTVEIIKPSELGEIGDSTYVGVGDDNIPNIVIGTTTRLIINVKYPNKSKKDDVYDNEWTYTKSLGKGDDYNLIVSNPIAKDGGFDYTIRIVANSMGSEMYSVKFNFANKIDYEYKFHIVDLVKPKDNQYEAKLARDHLNINESVKIDTKLVDPNGSRNDTYIRRYLDEAKIERSSSNNSVATIDENGVILAKGEGTANITFGKYVFPITVSSVINALPTSLDANIDPIGKDNPCPLDYDYIFEEGEDINDYSVVVKADISDKSVSWDIDKPLCAKLAPYKYDEEGYPVYFDDDGIPAIRVAGYRKNEAFNLTCTSNSNPTLSKVIPLEMKDVPATEVTFNVTGNIEIYVNEQKAVSIVAITPKNVSNKKINVQVSDESIIQVVNNNSESVILKAINIGKCHITIKSLSNETLTGEFDITTIAKQAINEDNFTDFHSFVRKFLGHFLLFMATAIFGSIFFITFFNDDKKKFTLGAPIALGIGFIVAALSELIQYFVPSRSGTWMDIGIDFAGYFVGVLACYLILLLVIWIKKRKKKDPQE